MRRNTVAKERHSIVPKVASELIRIVRRKRLCFVSVLVLLMIASAMVMEVSAEEKEVFHSSLIIRRFGCLNRCPEYRLEIRDTGSVKWEGYSNVAALGSAQVQLDPAIIQRLFASVFLQTKVSVCQIVQGLDGEASALFYSSTGDTKELEKYASSAVDLHQAALQTCVVSSTAAEALSLVEQSTNSHQWMHGSESLLETAKVWEDATYRTKPGFTALMSTAALGDPSELNTVHTSAEVNKIDDTGWTPLMVAASQCNISIEKRLLEIGADPNLVDQKHETALMAAASARCFRSNRVDEESAARQSLVRSLIAAGASIDLKDANGQTALMVAVRFANPEATKALLDAGADVAIRDLSGNTALTYARDLQKKAHQTYSRRYWNRYDKYYRGIVSSLTRVPKRQ
jgi:Ankyrin repeats (3 copies)/Domain of unknown function (DUF6438)